MEATKVAAMSPGNQMLRQATALLNQLDVGPRGPIVLMFYDGYELKAREKRGERLFHGARCAARAVWRRLKGKQVNTGFYVAFVALCDGLRQLGCDVRVNDFAAARANSIYPIGLAGYPDVLTRVDLPNPVIFGPGDPGYPDTAGAWADQDKVKFVIQPSDWFVDYYQRYCGDKMLRCPVGIDVAHLPDTRGSEKTIDVLIYDKIRWHQETLVPAVRGRLIKKLESEGKTYHVLEYGKHTQQMYFADLDRSRSMAFLCEHETQGLACEEAMAMNVPIFAWEEGRLVDPRQLPFAAPDLKVSSVPYFDEFCGATFTVDDLESAFDRFWSHISSYAPRDYIAANLSPESTAMVYLEAYASMVSLPTNAT
jgi:hypothetical protein